jgi:hypothetical protein
MIFRKKIIEHKMCVSICLPLLDMLFSLRETEWDVIKNLYWPSYNAPLIVPDFNLIWIFSTDFRQILKYQTSCKSDQLELSCVMRTDGQTERQDRHDEDYGSLFESLRNRNTYWRCFTCQFCIFVINYFHSIIDHSHTVLFLCLQMP